MFKCVAGLVATLSILATVQAAPTLPSYLLSTAAGPPLEVAYLLANASVPAGIEIHEADDVYPTPRPDFNRQTEARVPAGDLLRAFNTHHSDYEAMLTDGVFIIRPTTGRVGFLDAPSTIHAPVTVIGTMTAEHHVFSPLDPRLLSPTVGGGMGVEVAKGLRARVVLDGSHGRVLDTLNQIAIQVPGAWQVTTRRIGDEFHIVRIGYIYARGQGTAEQIGGR
jgi:hypothetical protein